MYDPCFSVFSRRPCRTIWSKHKFLIWNYDCFKFLDKLSYWRNDNTFGCQKDEADDIDKTLNLCGTSRMGSSPIRDKPLFCIIQLFYFRWRQLEANMDVYGGWFPFSAVSVKTVRYCEDAQLKPFNMVISLELPPLLLRIVVTRLHCHIICFLWRQV